MPTTTPTTLNDIRTDVLYLTQPFPLDAATAASGTSSTAFTDPLHLVDSQLGGVYVGAWLLRLGTALSPDNRERRIAAHNTLTGTLTPSPAFFDVPAAAESYEVWALDRPTYVERLVDRALGRVRAPLDTVIATVAGTRQYDLSAQAWLVRPSQVLGVVARSGTAPATDDSPVAGWRIYQDGTRLVLDLRESTWSDGSTLVLRAMRDYASGQPPLTWYGDSTTAAPRELVAHEVAYDLCRRPPQGLDTSPDLLNQRKERANDLKRSLLSIRDKYRSGIPVPLFAESESWGIGVGGHTPGDRWR